MKINSLLLAVATAILISCGKNPEKAAETAPSNVIKTALVRHGKIEERLLLNAKVACNETCMRKLYIPCTGKISQVNIEVGDQVKKGQLLAVVNSQDAASYQKERSDVASELRIAERNLLAATDLYESGMLSEREFHDISETVVKLKAAHEHLQTVATIHGYQEASTACIYAPISGYVLAKSVYNDSYVDETNNDTPAFEIADIRDVWVIADVYENDIAKVQEGAKVNVTTLAWPDEVFEGKIDKKFSMIDPESKTMKVRIVLSNPNGKLIPGIFASVHVHVSSPCEEAFEVPAESIVFESDRNFVMRKKDSSYECLQVKVLKMEKDNAWIEGCLQQGDEVVTQNALLVFNEIKSTAR